MIFDQGFHDECGVFGVSKHAEAANIAYLGLFALQHRGQESAGIVSTDRKSLYVHRGMGYVADVFDRQKIDALPGDSAIGHVRYSTQGSSHIKNAQPVVVSCWRGSIALSHNGNLVNANELRTDLERKGSIFQTTSDSEVILHLIAKSPEKELEAALLSTLKKIKGAYSLLLLTPSKMIAVRDPNGFRPLLIGRLHGAYVFASETSALDLIGAEFLREMDPGEVCIVTSGTILQSLKPYDRIRPTPCIFELIYFARPDSEIFNRSVHHVRKQMGVQLAREHPVDADFVMPVPDSGIGAAIGFAAECALPFEMGLIRNHYIGRTFIEPKQSIRDFGVKLKLNPVKAIIQGKRVVIVDDSIVRGTTSRKLVRMIRSVGAREVHIRISSPPSIGPCRYGIDTPTEEELIATQKSIEEICRYIGADSLGYLSIEGLLSSVDAGTDSFCLGCFDKNYPIHAACEQPQQRGLFEL